MFEYKLINKAVEDLSDIWKYTIEIWPSGGIIDKVK